MGEKREFLILDAIRALEEKPLKDFIEVCELQLLLELNQFQTNAEKVGWIKGFLACRAKMHESLLSCAVLPFQVEKRKKEDGSVCVPF